MPAQAYLVTKRDYSRISGVAPASITKALNKQLKAALVGDRINVEHPDSIAYLANKPGWLLRLTRLTPEPEPTKGKATASGRGKAPPEIPLPADVAEYGDLTLRQIYQRYPTWRQFKDVLDALKTSADIKAKELANAEQEGRVISRTLVQGAIVAVIDGLHRRLLGDLPRTVVSQCYAAARSDTAAEEAELLVRKTITANLEPTVQRVQRALND